ncbi:hypothetical protein A3D70_00330 [Candidatus Adlerbacteria bacterium RIFCSPHIGHO2_02_FULL_54_18]|uniref:Asp/Glu-ADT subunit C n=2 Tax=Candidatus Adleribacteriota TaxID=1752736 RepID=A0A1F4Y260_9BACT|nr:MAG: hypothetical protein A2949_00240 [Candidatus Adlerbacteria bacterium RIFCSPLOWO2_01_FULL_54_21b]OGC88057.1 MAG: hypothetical protein A3D70_00330 [Candidatus Adlerbacteria bacterium RIFCSPHIGHO2_02_FULL_54_18]
MISREEVLKLAELARIKVGEGEIARLQKDISDILEYVETVSTVKIPNSLTERDGVPPLRNVMREDTPRSTGDPLSGKEDALRAAFPKKENGYNVVRKIIQKDE